MGLRFKLFATNLARLGVGGVLAGGVESENPTLGIPELRGWCLCGLEHPGGFWAGPARDAERFGDSWSA